MSEPEKKPDKKEQDREIKAALGLMSQIGVSMAVCVFLGVMLGKYLDEWLGTSPALLVVCSFLGAGSSFKVLYDTVIKKWMK